MVKKNRIKKLFICVVIAFISVLFPLYAVSSTYQLDNINYYRVENTYYVENTGKDRARNISIDITNGNPYLVKNMRYSTLLNTFCLPQPVDIVTDKKGNQKGKFSIPKLEPGETKKIQVIQDYQVALIDYDIKSDNINAYEQLKYVLTPYLQPSPGIESDNILIQEKAREIVGSEQDPYLKTKRIFYFIYEYMDYEISERENSEDKGALWALKTGKGVCEDFSDLMVALLRATGVPARTVSGWMGKVEEGTGTLIADRNGALLPGHMWLEYYLVGYGWVPADPTYTYLVNGRDKVDYKRLTGLKELRFAETTETEGHPISYSFYGGDVQVTYEIKVSKLSAVPYINGNKGAIIIYLEDIPLFFDVDPVIINGRTLVPMRGIFQALGASVDWNGELQQVTAKTEDREVKLEIGKVKSWINDEEVMLDTYPQIIEGRTMIPLRFVGEALGCKVNWDGVKKVIDIRVADGD
ncbi:MAG: stalk domain-containing protein [Clostridia bacterium]|nr:stalk domain-containing protein [Clostridia bacterium]MDD4047664.1 stalk domain-containing protein [Clostridia bacterium]